ncbi:hypothetical protein LXL04_018922 [Taraxacum kok-saghyz]
MEKDIINISVETTAMEVIFFLPPLFAKSPSSTCYFRATTSATAPSNDLHHRRSVTMMPEAVFHRGIFGVISTLRLTLKLPWCELQMFDFTMVLCLSKPQIRVTLGVELEDQMPEQVAFLERIFNEKLLQRLEFSTVDGMADSGSEIFYQHKPSKRYEIYTITTFYKQPFVLHSMFPTSTHETFTQKLYQSFKNHKRFTKPNLAYSDFTVSHYACDVVEFVLQMCNSQHSKFQNQTCDALLTLIMLHS